MYDPRNSLDTMIVYTLKGGGGELSQSIPLRLQCRIQGFSPCPPSVLCIHPLTPSFVSHPSSCRLHSLFYTPLSKEFLNLLPTLDFLSPPPGPAFAHSAPLEAALSHSVSISFHLYAGIL
ncbi:UNVERIFIED_CONTAM: hypothetical protein K2H54_015847 [Gekko kuhli]